LKTIRLFIIAIAAIFILSLTSCPFDLDADNDIAADSAMEFAAKMKIGWNLGNSLDAHDNLTPNETAWGTVITTQALINAVAAQGFGAVRIPVTWGTKIGPAPQYKIDEAWLERVAEVVEYVRSAGMVAIINIHHDGADSMYWLSVRRADLTGASKTAIDNKFKAVWRQIAEYFKYTGNSLVFEGFNEIHDGGWGYTGTRDVHGVSVTTTAADLNNQRARVNELNQIFVDTVRAVGGRNNSRYLLINGLVTRPTETSATHFVMPDDSAIDKLIVGIHFYEPYNFAGSATQTTWGNKALPGNWANESNVLNQFNAVKAKFTDNGIPVIIGEYGAVRQSSVTGKAHRLYYMEYVTKHAVDCGFIPFYWDNGSNPNSNGGREQFGLFNRSTYTLANDAADVIRVMMKAVNEDYPLSDITPP